MTASDSAAENSVEICGALTEREAVRFTPAGIEVFEATLHHRNRLVEAGHVRSVEFDFSAVAFGEVAGHLNALATGTTIRIKGFLAPRSMKSRSLTVHITEFNTERSSNGFWC